MTQTSTPADCRGSHWAACGFTLIEILVVLTVVGVIATAAVVRLHPSDFSKAAHEAERISLVMESARDEAIFGGRSIGISSDGQGFQLWTLAGSSGEWTSLPPSELLVARRLVDGVSWKTQRINEHTRPLGERIVFPADGVPDPFVVELAAGEAVMTIESDAMGRIEVHDVRQ